MTKNSAGIGARLDRLRIRHLRFLELIDTHGSLSAAAGQLSLSQPAATKMLQEIESVFGAALVERTTRGAALTPTGQLALGRLRIALNALSAAMEAIHATPAPVPIVHVGILPLVGVVAMPRLLARLAARPGFPHLVIHESTVSGLLGMLDRGEIDCMVGRIGSRREGEATSGMRVMPLWEERLTVACALDHPLARKRSVALSHLCEYDWITTPRGASTRMLFEAPFLDAGIVPPQPKIESFSFHTNLCMVAGSRLLTVAPETAVRHYAGLGMVRQVRHGSWFAGGRTVFVTREDAADAPGVAAVGEALAGLMGGGELGGAGGR
ncbi:LysR family transcriptional regulator [Cupriavidus gilardii]|uniref:LysR family transcriptional regulator n=2 Tax=Cupriavidus gilardii TaxID=82541 RepID=A0A849BAZ0_9BURK|nr:LysR family transcriptional regulator [Cupriavidus gilardii]ALD90517.1 LysR family transcriptional regulator [Cupriavidus gilardii CR3]QQE07972.1 LysR family transcriptional regulator [Cupriavidus sp. ISTL7]KAB0594226.1 LysR family transcriptional regulator [Cupriavidus gilardii]MCT9119155.1 LysR family transcriptional regulator [Cupriavidus gilardii]NNH12951.1 LysR family transcriptional regulator [Cupriavidus gilardii]